MNLKRNMLTVLAPPVAVCLYGCAGCCAAPIGVFWLTGVVSITGGLLGGPTNAVGPDWGFVLLGLGLWGFASAWTALAIRTPDTEKCLENSNFCNQITPDHADKPDPLDEVRKTR
jgi:hypothetical protein